MPISLNEIKERALAFSHEWADETSEQAEAQTFWNEFFYVLTSSMKWVQYTCGRIKSDYRYSNELVYNNFPWPKDPSEKNKKKVETKAQKILDVRKEFPNSSLADLYNPLTMPPKLAKAHNELDKAVDLCYRPQAFPTEMSRIEYLFYLYQYYTDGLFKHEKYKIKSRA